MALGIEFFRGLNGIKIYRGLIFPQGLQVGVKNNDDAFSSFLKISGGLQSFCFLVFRGKGEVFLQDDFFENVKAGVNWSVISPRVDVGFFLEDFS